MRRIEVNTSLCTIHTLQLPNYCMFPFHRFSPDAKVYASGSRDGSIKIWDGVSNRCVNTFVKAHGGSEVCSVTFTRNGKASS